MINDRKITIISSCLEQSRFHLANHSKLDVVVYLPSSLNIFHLMLNLPLISWSLVQSIISPLRQPLILKQYGNEIFRMRIN